ncbi:Retrovirus-related Pol polyprotein from transposon TNT 1-94 [Senna tora]|uniref:Retrovirus-related Pol polyprotein from transposon TNT 1-94 n=1 Tax=Senna tora TaxID=362788 RepID=A0A834WJH2_9FABA|nr:Retrovirus-related Pol polyprotein from transposon TNT 1-94 [Senna tora]
MKAILRKDNCLSAIEDKLDTIADDKWKEMGNNAVANLHLALADSVLSSVAEKKTAKEIWDALVKLYELTASDYKIVENERAELLLQSLPDSYDQLIINITNNNTADHLTFDDVAGAILEEESRRKNKEDRSGSSKQAEALTMTRGRSMERDSSGSHGQGRSKSRRRKNVQCYNCGKRGHLKKDCWNIKKNTEKSPEVKSSQGCVASTSDDGEILAVIGSEGGKQLTDVWIIDSGATWHMTSKRDWFCTYEPISGGSVFMGNDHALEIAGIGTVKLQMYDGTVQTIQGVRHVKGLKKNLLSIGQLDDLRCKTYTEGGILKVMKGALVVMKGEKIKSNLYVLMGDTLQKAEASVATSNQEETSMMWHLKLGHMSERGLKVLAERNLLHGLKSVVVSRDVIFAENELPSEQRNDSTVKETTTVQIDEKLGDDDSSEVEPEHNEQVPDEVNDTDVRRSLRQTRPPSWHSDYVMTSHDAYCKVTFALNNLPINRRPSTHFHSSHPSKE